MICFKCTVGDEHGIHARPAGAIVNCAKKFASQITLKKGEREANAKRLISVMGLGAKYGDELTVFVEGEDENNAASEIQKLLCSKQG